MIFQWQAQQSLPFVFSTHIRRLSFNPLGRSVLLHIFLRSASLLVPSCRPVSFVLSFGSLHPFAHLSSFGFCARSVLSSCFLRSILWAAPFCRTSFFFQLLGSLRPVFEFLVFLLAVCRAVLRSRHNRCLFGVRGRIPMAWTGRRAVVFAGRWAVVGAVVGSFLPRGNGLGEMTQCGASSIAAHCIVHRSALRLALQRSAFVACPSCYHRCSRFHEEIYRAGLFPRQLLRHPFHPFSPILSVSFVPCFSSLLPVFLPSLSILYSRLPIFFHSILSFRPGLFFHHLNNLCHNEMLAASCGACGRVGACGVHPGWRRSVAVGKPVWGNRLRGSLAQTPDCPSGFLVLFPVGGGAAFLPAAHRASGVR